MEYNANLPTATVMKSDRAADLHTINGQKYLTITQSEGRKLMQRIKKPSDGRIDRVLAQGHTQIETDDESPDFVLIEATSNDTVKGACSSFFGAIIKTSQMEVKRLSFYQAIAAEFLGTLLLVLIVCALGVKLDSGVVVPSIVGAFGGALTVSTMIWFSNSISGGNVNPAITIALLLTNELNYLRGVCYIIAQLLGALCGFKILMTLLPSDLEGISQIGLTLVNPKIPIVTAFGVEFIITFLLTFTAFASIDKKRKDLGGSYPLSIGLSVFIGAMFGGAYTGGSMNPARSFGPAVIQNVWTLHWVYWCGPISGALFAALVYKFFLKPTTILKALI